jgi:hypothetical protein
MTQKYTFLWALILTLVIFNIGILFGYQLEKSRINNINEWYQETDLNLLDQRIQSDSFDIIGLNCNNLLEENIKFGDKIYEDASQIQKYEDANQLNTNIISQHKKNDLLRAMFWMNSIKIKQKCQSNYHNIVYFYDYNNPTLNQIAKQRTFSNLLMELKNEKKDEIMLIPIAGDNELPSIDLILEKYNIQIEDLPVILIDEKTKIEDIKDKSDIEKYLN